MCHGGQLGTHELVHAHEKNKKTKTKLVANATHNLGDKAGFCVHRCLNMKE